MFRRQHHKNIAALLARLDASLLRECECGFAGGTAIAMLLGEFRRSDDIDFLCASAPGYRRLREIVFDQGLSGLTRQEVPILRAPRADQYGIRAIIGSVDQPVKLEIAREARIALKLGDDAVGAISVLSRNDLYAEKLLANADRGLDSSTLQRDMIDLCMMIHSWGPIPPSSLNKACDAYGHSVTQSLAKVAQHMQQGSHLHDCLRALDADTDLADVIRPVLQTFGDG